MAALRQLGGNLLATLVVLSAGLGCRRQAIDLSGLPCRDGQCLDGYVCHPQTDHCVPTLAIGCAEPGSLCPSRVQDGDPCATSGSFIPCADDGVGCADGCRTCQADGTWSLCLSEGPCVPTNDGVETCDGIDNDCDGTSDNPGATSCSLFYRDADDDGHGVADDSQCLCAAKGVYRATMGDDCDDGDSAIMPGAREICDGKDNDCAGGIDNAPDDAPACTQQAGICAGSVAVACGGAAGWTACATQVYSDWAQIHFSATYEDTGGGAETLCGDGVDNDCDGVPDDGCPMIVPTNLGQVDLCQGATDLVLAGAQNIDTTDGSISGITGPVTEFISQGGGAPEIMVFYFKTIIVEPDAVATVTGDRALALVACTNMTIAGNIAACAAGNVAGPGGWPGGAAANPEEDGLGPGAGIHGAGQDMGSYKTPGGGGASFCGAGGAGGKGDGLSGGAAGTTYSTAAIMPLQGGSGGGGGGAFQSGGHQAGGGGGGAVQLVAGGALTVTPTGGVNVCGAGGGADRFDRWGGGGGGGSGGAILIEALDVTVYGTLAANGGGGGGGDATFYDDPPGAEATAGGNGPYAGTRASGGIGADGPGSDTGGNGGQGGANASIAGSAGASAKVGGGGGGGAGTIRVNSDGASALVVDANAVLSPGDVACYSAGNVEVQ
jgi:hypothetical protein